MRSCKSSSFGTSSQVAWASNDLKSETSHTARRLGIRRGVIFPVGPSEPLDLPALERPHQDSCFDAQLLALFFFFQDGAVRASAAWDNCPSAQYVSVVVDITPETIVRWRRFAHLAAALAANPDHAFICDRKYSGMRHAYLVLYMHAQIR
jgi:hypothetical protein